ncbi:MAG: hypothetical protein AB7O88_11820 [Reyranellaceae bacterium]
MGRYAAALLAVMVTGPSASARSEIDLADAARFCAAVFEAGGGALDRAEERIDTIKREIAAIAALEAKRAQVAAEIATARQLVARQRRDVEALRSQLANLSPTMFEERRVVGADLTAHLEVLDRYRQIEALLEIELTQVDGEIATRRARMDPSASRTIAASEPELRRCLEERRRRLR